MQWLREASLLFATLIAVDSGRYFMFKHSFLDQGQGKPYIRFNTILYAINKTLFTRNLKKTARYCLALCQLCKVQNNG